MPSQERRHTSKTRLTAQQEKRRLRNAQRRSRKLGAVKDQQPVPKKTPSPSPAKIPARPARSPTPGAKRVTTNGAAETVNYAAQPLPDLKWITAPTSHAKSPSRERSASRASQKGKGKGKIKGKGKGKKGSAPFKGAKAKGKAQPWQRSKFIGKSIYARKDGNAVASAEGKK